MRIHVSPPFRCCCAYYTSTVLVRTTRSLHHSPPPSADQVIDRSTRRGEFDDPSSVAKFELSDEQYAQRYESLRAFKKTHKLGQFSEDAIAAQTSLEEARAAREQQWRELAEKIHIGSRHILFSLIFRCFPLVFTV